MYNANMYDISKILFETSEGIILVVRLVPNSSFSKIVDYTNEYIRIKISAPPIENKANKELLDYFSHFFSVNKSKISIVSGEKSKLKKILIKDTNLDELRQKLIFVIDSLHKEK